MNIAGFFPPIISRPVGKCEQGLSALGRFKQRLSALGYPSVIAPGDVDRTLREIRNLGCQGGISTRKVQKEIANALAARVRRDLGPGMI